MTRQKRPGVTRREVLQATAAVAAPSLLAHPVRAATSPKQFNLWAFGDAHVGTDIKHGRESLTEALRQSEFGDDKGAPPFEWDIAVNVGDLSGAAKSPDAKEGREVKRQLATLKRHPREAIYDICGNHDRNVVGEPDADWFRHWIDPTGEHTETSGVEPSRRPYPVEGTWERYSFRIGNMLFLMMSDRNEPTQKIGRGELGGNPSGVVTGETFAWWRAMVEANRDSIIICAHHYVLKNTTVASGAWEGMQKTPDGLWASKYHGYYEKGTPQGASYLYWQDSEPDGQRFEKYLEAHPGAIAMWFGGHTHTNPDDTAGGKSHIETRWGSHFLNVCALTRFHVAKYVVPMSRLLSFTNGSDEVRVRCYLHTDRHAPRGWYKPAERVLKLPRAFQQG